MKKGFSLGEMIVTIGIVGFLAAVLLPVLKSILPNQEMLMFKKAYYITERAIAELVNDEDLYPESYEPDAKQYLGNVSRQMSKGKAYEGSTKFCELFAAKINRSSEVSCTNKTFTDGQKPEGTVATTDGTVWILPVSSFDSETEPEDIYIDVNGSKGPNCAYNKTSCKKPDRFNVKVYQDGRVEVVGIMEREYLNRVNIAQDAGNETEEAKKEDDAKK